MLLFACNGVRIQAVNVIAMHKAPGNPLVHCVVLWNKPDGTTRPLGIELLHPYHAQETHTIARDIQIDRGNMHGGCNQTHF